MKRKNVIVVISEEVEVFGNFKKMCEAKGFPYHSLKMKPFPITHENVVIHRVPFKQRLTFECFASVVPIHKLLSAQLSKTLVNRCLFVDLEIF